LATRRAFGDLWEASVKSSRPSTTLRGYGTAHQAAGRRLEPLVRAGLAVCARCGEPLEAGEPFDLDHTDDRTGYLGASHVKCNRGAVSRDRARRVSRQW
jgi:hypothetical protein